uniref:Alpha-ketoglutarate-dependent dioxygenase AlkB-like domain-containing protein n=1 Tax=Alexandrium monilatum TaxID=311494 RepID=A0A7S4VB97_9DINO
MSVRRWGGAGATACPPARPHPAAGDGPRAAEAGVLYTCGCGHLAAEVLCDLLRTFGIGSVLDVRELDHSAKRPWFNADALAGTMRRFGLGYRYVGGDREDAAAVSRHASTARAPVCLLGVRALVRECQRLHLSQRLQEGLGWSVVHLQLSSGTPPALKLLPSQHDAVYARHTDAAAYVGAVARALGERSGLSGRWQDRVAARHDAVPWERWDSRGRTPWPSGSRPPLVIQLPWDTLLMVLPGFLSKTEVHGLQQRSLPGALQYDQPLRQVRNPDGTFTQFNEHQKEAWLSDHYDHRDARRVLPPRVHAGRALPAWALELLARASRAALAPFNGIMCRWEPPGVHPKDGPHTYATHSGWADETVIGLMAVGATRSYRVHGIPWYLPCMPKSRATRNAFVSSPARQAEGCGSRLRCISSSSARFYGRGRRKVVAVDMPLAEGTLIVLGGAARAGAVHAAAPRRPCAGQGHSRRRPRQLDGGLRGHGAGAAAIGRKRRG